MISKNIGFTLTELLVVVTLIVLLGLSSAVFFQEEFSRLNRVNYERSLENTLKYALAYAQSHQVEVGICPSLDNQNCSPNWQNALIVFLSEGQTLTKPIQIIRQLSAPPSSLTLSFKGFPRSDVIIFSPISQGLGQQSSGRFLLCTKKKELSIALVMSNMGRFRKESGNVCD